MPSIITTLEMAREGTFLDRLEAEFQDLNIATLKTGKAGTLTLKIKATPDGDGQIEYLIDSTIAAPKFPVKTTMFVDKKTGVAQVTNQSGRQTDAFPEPTTRPEPQPLKVVV